VTPREVDALRETLRAHPLPPVPVLPSAGATRTPYRRRRAAALREPVLPGMSARSLRGRDPLAGLFRDNLVIEVEKHSATLVGISRTRARDLLLDAGVYRQHPDYARGGCQVFPAKLVPEVEAHVLAAGGTVVVRRLDVA
jgi:hypothetical protein